MKEKIHNASDAKQVRKRQDRQKLESDQRKADIAYLVSLPQFRRVIWWYMNERCGMMHSAFSPNGSQQTLNIGRQDAGREWWSLIESADPKAIPQMMLEYLDSQVVAD